MKQLVIMPGGFHPFHAGHLALYKSALERFPRADVYVAATADTSTRPFPFKIKQQLARLAGVPRDRFVQVKSPFQAKEITSQYDADQTQLIFVRSDKDKDQPPQPGGAKKDGTPAYLQPLDTENLPMSERGYMTYLPTVEFASGMTSATELRAKWPLMRPDQKTDLINALYPATAGRAEATAKIVAMFDETIGQSVPEAVVINDPESGHQIRPDGGMGTWNEDSLVSNLARKFTDMGRMLESGRYGDLYSVLYQSQVLHNMLQALAQYQRFRQRLGRRRMAAGREVEMDENQGWAATLEQDGQMAGTPAAGMQASYQQRENQPMDEDYVEEKWSDKYKRSIDCDRPRGFSQRAHCAGRKK